MANIKFFTKCNGETVQLNHVNYLSEKDIRAGRYMSGVALDIPTNTGKNAARYILCSGGGRPAEYAYAVGHCPADHYHVAERMIERPAMSNNHKCNARCTGATGKVCECSCGGKNHGGGQ